jgi:hypothetical protein
MKELRALIPRMQATAERCRFRRSGCLQCEGGERGKGGRQSRVKSNCVAGAAAALDNV